LTYHPTCHSTRFLGLRDQPLRLLAAVAGLELVDLPDAGECCGFGGTFSVRNPEVSAAMLAEKLRAVESTGADAVCACDASCLMQMRGGLERAGSPVRAVHLAEVLAG
jgi:L-lactate dehydrogenase complex protein LldE